MRDPDGSLRRHRAGRPADHAGAPAHVHARHRMDFNRFGRQPRLRRRRSPSARRGTAAAAGRRRRRRVDSPSRLAPLEAQPGRAGCTTSVPTSSVSSSIATGRSLGCAHRSGARPLGMDDPRFSVPAGSLDRFGACFGTRPGSGERWTFDEVDGQWSRPPAFPSGGAGLVSTIDDYLAFPRMLRAGGRHERHSVVPAEVRDRDDDEPGSTAVSRGRGIDLSGDQGFGFCVGVLLRATADGRHAGTYGWSGGLGERLVHGPRRRPDRDRAHKRDVQQPRAQRRRSARRLAPGRDQRTERVEVGEDRRCRRSGGSWVVSMFEAVDVD